MKSRNMATPGSILEAVAACHGGEAGPTYTNGSTDSTGSTGDADSATVNSGSAFNNEAVTRHGLASLDIEGCAALPNAPARFDCLRAAFTAPAETCIDPFDD